MAAKFGREFRKKHFEFEEGVVELNHGSYGAAPTVVVEAQLKHIKQKHSFPNRYLRYELFDISRECRKQISKVVDADYHDVVFTPNATTAVNAVLRSYPWKRGDKIAYFSTIYGACLNTLRFIDTMIGLQLVPIELDFPMTDAQIEAAMTKVLNENPDTKMVFMDTVTSMPAVVLPWENLVRICRERNVLSFVDGAHGIGLIPISLRTARPDYFTSNLHKWMYGTTSTAILYVDPAHHRQVAPVPISWIYVEPSKELDPDQARNILGDTFCYVATADYSAMQSTIELLNFRKEICGGDEVIFEYQNKLAKEASKMICDEFGTKDINTSSTPMAMFTILFPYEIEPELQRDFILFAHEKFAKEYKTFIPLESYKNKLYARFSASIYLELDDFKVGIAAIRSVVEEWKQACANSDTEQGVNCTVGQIAIAAME